jgi:glycosyltransferase involved in cell wall biosynthesis
MGLPPAEEIASRILGRAVTPLVLDYWQRYPKGLDDLVAKLADRHSWKAVIVEYIWLHPAAGRLNNGIARLLDTHDIQHKRVEEFATREMTFPLKITREEESRIFNRFDAVIAIQAEEAALVRTMCPEAKVLTVGTTGSSQLAVSNRPIDGRILYIGGYNGANIDGLRRFLELIWPQIRQRYGQAHLHVCGHVYRAFLGERFDKVNFLGHLEDVEGEYAEATVILNPCWIGTGLKIKSVAALARCKPLVTTTKGIEGLNNDVVKSCLVSDDDLDFANNVVQLLTDCKARERLYQASNYFRRTHLSPGIVYKELLEFLDSWP